MIGIVGFGRMGSGIALVFALKGHTVRAYDSADPNCERGLKSVAGACEWLAKRSASIDCDTALKNIRCADGVSSAVSGAELVVEAVPEDLAIKVAVIEEASRADERAIITSNTSGLPITLLQRRAARPRRIAGFHWFNPPYVMALVEVVKGEETDAETVDRLVSVARSLDKEPVLVMRDVRGFIANRVYRAVRYQAAALFRRGIYGVREIDSALRYRAGFPMGVFELMDYAGSIEIEYHDGARYDEVRSQYPEWEPSPGYERAFKYAWELFAEMYRAGRLGVRTGVGFYTYPGPGTYKRPELAEEEGRRVDVEVLVAPAVNEALRLIAMGISDRDSIARALSLGFNIRADVFGLVGDLPAALERARRLLPELEEFYRPAPRG